MWPPHRPGGWKSFSSYERWAIDLCCDAHSKIKNNSSTTVTHQHPTPNAFSFVFQLSKNVLYVIMIHINSSIVSAAWHSPLFCCRCLQSLFDVFSFFAAKILSINVFCIFYLPSSSTREYTLLFTECQCNQHIPSHALKKLFYYKFPLLNLHMGN